MLKSKTFDRICCAAIAVMLLITIVLWTGKVDAGRQIITVGYEGLFSQDKVHTINIEMDADAWGTFIKKATSEEYVECTVTIDGEKLSNVAIRAKGNTSLSSVAGLGTEKYSFKIEFDAYDSSRKYHGLDKLSLNNLIYDATMMKDYLAYTLMGKMGVPSPLCSFTWVTVNGEDFGLYLACEAVEDGFLTRNSMTVGELYKPDSMSFGGGRGNGGDFDIEVFRVEEDEEGSETSAETATAETATTETTPAVTAEDNGFGASGGGQANNDGFGASGGGQSNDNGFGASGGGQASDNGFGASSGDRATATDMDWDSSGAPAGDGTMPDPGDFDMGDFGGMFGGFNFGMGNSDVKLQYSDDDFDSYSNIFNNAKTDITDKDKERLIESLRKLGEREDLQDVVFADEIINYLVVHDFVRNGDSYTGSMVHNYYLYEENGHLAIIPWDYNLGFGGFSGGTNGKSTVNSSIDSPVDGTIDDRPLVAWIFHDDEALDSYHTAYEKFVNEYIFSGWGEDGTQPLSVEIDRVANLIRSYVEKDPNGFFSVDEFDVAIETMKDFCDQRGQSVRDQLAGKSTSELNYGNGLNLSAMGAMNSGGNQGGGMPGGRGFGAENTDENAIPSDLPENPTGVDPGDAETDESSSEVEITEKTTETETSDTAFDNASSGSPAGNGAAEGTDFAASSGAPSDATGTADGTDFAASSGAPSDTTGTADGTDFAASSGAPAGNETTDGTDFAASSGAPAGTADGNLPENFSMDNMPEGMTEGNGFPQMDASANSEAPTGNESTETPINEETQNEETSETASTGENESQEPVAQDGEGRERTRGEREGTDDGGSFGGSSGERSEDDGFGPSSGGPGGDGSGGGGMPGGPGGFGGDSQTSANSNTGSMSWGEFGFYALLLAAAIVLISLLPHHNR